MDIKIKLYNKPNRLSVITLTSLLAGLNDELEMSIHRTLCDMNKSTSRTRIAKAIKNHVLIDIDRFERGSFILFLMGSVAATVANVVYDVIKPHIIRRIETKDIERELEKYSRPILENIEKDIKKTKRLGTLFIDEINSEISDVDGCMTLDLEIILYSKRQGEMPITTADQIAHKAHELNVKIKSKEQ